MWFTNYLSNKIGKITTSGTITEYTLASGAPLNITTGPEGDLWFTNWEANHVGKITTSGSVTEYKLPAGSSVGGIVSGPDNNLWFTFSGSSRIGMITPSGTITKPTEALAPVPAKVSCAPTMNAGCRALKFQYATETTAKGENQSEWGTYNGRLTKVLMEAYNPVSKKMEEPAVAEYSYDKMGRLRAEWDPRISPALKTTYGYDEEGHVTALDPPGQEPWAFTYGAAANDSGTGRLLKARRASAATELWKGEIVKNTEAPKSQDHPIWACVWPCPTANGRAPP